MKNSNVIAAFQTWSNGSEVQTSGLITGEGLQAFLQRSENSGTFAHLHTFTDMNAAIAAFDYWTTPAAV